jgi:hypothetical protein
VAKHVPTPVTAPVTPRLVNRRTAASYLGLALATFDALRGQGEIAPVPVPAAHRHGALLRTPLFDLQDLDALVDKWKARGAA